MEYYFAITKKNKDADQMQIKSYNPLLDELAVVFWLWNIVDNQTSTLVPGYQSSIYTF